MKWCPLRIRINEGLLVDTTHSLDGADIEGILATKIARVGRLDLSVRHVVFLLLLQGNDLCLGQSLASFGNVLLQR